MKLILKANVSTTIEPSISLGMSLIIISIKIVMKHHDSMPVEYYLEVDGLYGAVYIEEPYDLTR
ncbi:hypothetical protein UB34_12860 [Photobacterium leiognathi]|nr:hypothetical protein UB34_12860 [Photobacterium leiognathi]